MDHDNSLWALEKGGHRMECRVRASPFAAELRIVLNGELWWSNVYSGRPDTALEQVAESKRAEFEAKGWTRPSAG
jgi:hypothetical protein